MENSQNAHYFVDGVCIIHNIRGFNMHPAECHQSNEPQMILVSSEFVAAAKELFRSLEWALTRIEQSGITKNDDPGQRYFAEKSIRVFERAEKAGIND